jgi:DNA-binding MarR family transcriptional regulator
MATIIEQRGDECLVEVPIRLPLAEIERLTRIVDRARQSGMVPTVPQTVSDAASEKLATFAHFMINARRRRDTMFVGIEFGEPAWDMLLDLYIQHVRRRRVAVSSLCTAAAVPATTALRWIDVMVRDGHFVRQRDPQDGRRVHVSLSANLVDTIESYLSDMRQRAVAALL